MTAIPYLTGAIADGGLSQEMGTLVSLRASQINGCAACVYGHVPALREPGVSQEQIDTVTMWRHSPYFSEKERAAQEQAEATARPTDSRGEPASDELWNRARLHFDEPEPAAPVLAIASINFFNRVNVTIQEQAGTFWEYA